MSAVRKHPAASVKNTQQARPPIFLYIGIGIAAVGLIIFALTSNVSGGQSGMPQFTAPALDGSTIELSDYHGQVIMLNFWATWCPPCRAEMPSIQRAYERYSADGLVVLAINNGEQPAQIAPFIQANALNFPVVLDVNRELQQAFNISGYPTSLFIGRDGKAYATHVGMVNPVQLTGYIETGLAAEASS
ncbi:MAG: TlpA family protein disulfide reductase [Anaerolinea sp.]|nr:TlpA family protein disulfide reductase [Anaerolinea sp.]